MGNAYQCDRCDEFDTGEPHRYRLIQYLSASAIGGWGGRTERRQLELCNECAESLESTVGEWLEDGDREVSGDE